MCTGSANFSTNSLIANDENTLLIRGDTRVPDIYLTELDRIFEHFYDRDAINRSAANGETREWLHLDTTDTWIKRNFRANSYKKHRLDTSFPDSDSAAVSWTTRAEEDDHPFADEEARAEARRERERARRRGEET